MMAPRGQRSRSAASREPYKAFGSQMKRYRIRANIVQDTIAAHTHVTTSFVSQIETGKKACKREFAAIVDELCHADGALLELWDNLYCGGGSAIPAWFADWEVVESEAASLITWQPTILPGLLQTEAYAREFLATEEAVAKRLGRQQVLTREEPAPASLVALLSPAVLTYSVGTREVMCDQLDHLVAMAERPNVSIQVTTVGGRPAGTGGAFVVATMPDRSEVAYLETAVRGITTELREDLSGLSEALRHLQAKALPEAMSVEAIRKAREELA
ncbi:helix-turn-helix domain-containing protein [Actinomadura gamaensis]|uniref:Helix-turn-helix domain-containing protein n=1 Tax=Actinomadura gamaensis TaxID=1763541 RepID=A0ABV9TTN7_9ACTN